MITPADLILFFRVNDTGVSSFEFTIYGKQQYPKLHNMPWPKAGTTLPKTTVTIVDITSWKATTIKPDPVCFKSPFKAVIQ